jgi:Glycosyltransferase family 87
MVTRFRSSLWLQGLYVAGVCAAALLGLWLLRRAIPGYFPQNWAAANEYDALTDWKAARLFWLGVSPYSAEGLRLNELTGMGHPPTMAFWYLPLAEFSKEVVAELTSMSALCLIPLHVYLCAKELRFPAPIATAWVGGAALLCTSWFQYHFGIVQLSEHIAFLYVLAWSFLRRGQDLRAGICLGAATSFKLFPGLLVLLLLLGGRFRGFFAACSAYLAIALVMTWAYGPKSWLQFLEQQAPISKRWMGSIQNSSLPGLVTRLLSPACEGTAIPTHTGTLLVIAVSCCLLALAAWLCRSHLRQAREGDARAIDLPFALFALLSAFLNAWAWEHYFVIAVQPIMILMALFVSLWRRTFCRWCAEASGGKSLALVSLVTVGAGASLALVFWSLSLNFREKDQLRVLWFQTHAAFYHTHMHLLEAANFVPWVVPIALCVPALLLSRNLYRSTWEL